MDVYKRSVTDESFNGWENFVFSYGNIFRKVESDWMKSYLAREENSDKGKISWKIDVSGSGLFIDKVVIKCSYLALEDAEVVWSVSSGGFEKEIDKISKDSHKPDPHLSGSQSAVAHPNFINESVMSLHHEDGVEEILINVKLQKGSNWQHAQIFRQDLEDKSLDLGFTIHLK